MPPVPALPASFKPVLSFPPTLHPTGAQVRLAYAEGNALGKGPVLFHVSQRTIDTILSSTQDEDEQLQPLRLNMFR